MPTQQCDLCGGPATTPAFITLQGRLHCYPCGKAWREVGTPIYDTLATEHYITHRWTIGMRRRYA